MSGSCFPRSAFTPRVLDRFQESTAKYSREYW
jgi:hypothetical protein